ncbi:ganglioside-induced differentiation-associated protein 1-like [Haliotis rubra]|uniref:ganglioside-induced differentiation-associated protein 1-like n=1 Tax=Haliotis rubra TaxID=36100 RepID=UPI001EE5A65C|nr:ganglioside-induced differentiation-associated protein 1-like [Haliotis rubra]
MAAPTPRFTLYMSGTSYFAQKALMALFVKNEPFAEKLVDQNVNDNYESWYMKLNPLGKVPVLEDRGKIIPESDDIIDYLDKELPQGLRLVPEPSTDLGREVAHFRKLLNVNVVIIIFGLAYNPHLSPDYTAAKTRKELDEIIDGKIAKLERYASENPNLRDAYLAKIPPLQQRKELCSNPEVVQRALDDLQTTLDEVEAKVIKGSPGETWLLSSDLTAADISLAVLLRRVSLSGLASLYFSPTQRPALHKYWLRLQTLPAYCRLSDIAVKYGVKA